MNRIICGLLAVLVLPAVAAADRTAGDPLGKVYELLNGLKAKIADDFDKQDRAYAKYSQWCTKSAAEMTYEIDKSNAQQDELTSKNGKLSSDIEVGDSKVKDLTAAISKAEAELKEATAIRKKESEEFVEGEKELVNTVSTLERSLAQLQKQLSDGGSFAQLDTSVLSNVMQVLSVVNDAASLSGKDESALASLVQQEDGDDSMGAPKEAAYSKQSGGIMDLIEDMKEKAEGQLQDLRQAEIKQRNSYKLLKQSLEDQLKADRQELAEEKSGKAEAQENKAGTMGGLEAEKKELAVLSKKRDQLAQSCQMNAADHEANVAARKAETQVLNDAEKVLQESTGGAGEQSGYSFLQTKATSHSKAQSRATQLRLAQSAVMNTVERLAREHHSRALANLASRISAQLKFAEHGGAADPFSKVKNLLKSMIGKLEKQASAEATEKAYCDAEMPKSKAKADELEDIVSKLTAKMAKIASQSSKLKQEVSDLQGELANQEKESAESDSIRREEHAAFIAAKKDLELGLNGVRKALTTLRNYYGSAAASAALLQEGDAADSDGDDRDEMASLMQQAVKQPQPPQKGAKSSGAGGSIIDLLEVVESDFAKNLATEDTEESDAVNTYDKMKQTSAIAKAEKETAVKAKTGQFKALDKSLSDLAKDKATEVEELNAVMQYYGQIKDRCIAKPQSYDEIKARREAEISGLKEALASLESEALMQTAVRSRRGRKSLRGDSLAVDSD